MEATLVPGTWSGPERGLWAAIVADAIDICLGRTFAPPNERVAARRWVESSRPNVGGFLWCCHLLGLDETAVRQRIGRAGRDLGRGPSPRFRYGSQRASRRAGRPLQITPGARA